MNTDVTSSGQLLRHLQETNFSQNNRKGVYDSFSRFDHQAMWKICTTWHYHMITGATVDAWEKIIPSWISSFLFFTLFFLIPGNACINSLKNHSGIFKNFLNLTTLSQGGCYLVLMYYQIFKTNVLKLIIRKKNQ